MGPRFLMRAAVAGFAALLFANVNVSAQSDRATPTGTTIVPAPTPAPAKRSSNLNSSKSNRGAASTDFGTVTSVNAAARTVRLKHKDGTTLVVDASRVGGNLPKVGQRVRVQYLVVNGKPRAQALAVTR